MSRAAVLKTTIVSAVAAAVIGVGGWAYLGNLPNHKVTLTTNSKQQTTQISYQGVVGVDALTLLKKHADIKTKHYSFGDQVVAINGTTGNGPKYWTFYVNGKMSMVGAGDYKTKAADALTWKLQ